jgi:transcriptional regulator with XRE-family HTH domain
MVHKAADQADKADQAAERTAFDADAFYATIDGERRSRALNWKEVAAEAGVSQSTLTRLGQGKRPDVDSFARLVAWGGFAADQFVMPSKLRQTSGFLTTLPAALRSDPNLDDKSVRALETIIRAAYDQFRQSS